MIFILFLLFSISVMHDLTSIFDHLLSIMSFSAAIQEVEEIVKEKDSRSKPLYSLQICQFYQYKTLS